MSRPIDMVLPDAGPLISLAHADRLDLLELFRRPVIVLDVVKREALCKPASPDHDRLLMWFERPTNRLTIAETPFGDLYRDALDRERAGGDPMATRGLGDAALSWALANIDRFAHPDAVPLVLVEDRRLSIRLRTIGRAHILSTRTWLAALDEAGLVDFGTVIAAMAAHGRQPSMLAIESPAIGDGEPSTWLDAAEDDDQPTR